LLRKNTDTNAEKFITHQICPRFNRDKQEVKSMVEEEDWEWEEEKEEEEEW